MDCAEATVGGKPHGHAAGDFPQPTYHELVSERRKPQGSRARFQEPRGRDERVAPDRHAVPTCRHFGVCGGCNSLDLPIADREGPSGPRRMRLRLGGAPVRINARLTGGARLTVRLTA